ncbi:MAG: APC family permease, partial [Methanoregula sp.]|nr:APC family permease [Methanoregula sp.]
MSRDGLLPKFFSDIHPHTHTPTKSILFIGIITAFVAGLFPLATVAELVNMGTLVAFAIVALGVLILRKRQPELKRPFRCPAVPYVPVLCIGSCAFLILHLKPVAHRMFLVWLCIGLLVYFLYGIRNSENKKHPIKENTGPDPGPINRESSRPHIPEIDIHKMILTDIDK